MPILGYLVDPALQIEDVNGKPLVGGTLRVFRHGTTIPYITWKDFTGDRNPATVVLDAKGMAILLAEPGYLYDVYCEDRHGVPQWSRLNVPVEAGGMGISSSDGSLVISQTDTGGGVSYDITVAQDSGEMLEWLRTDGYTGTDLGMRPTFSAGTMAVGDYGVRLAGGVYYHVTARVKATVGTLQPDYNEFDILFKGWTQDGAYVFLRRPVVIDGSITSTQEWEISFDTIPSADVELYVATDGLSRYNTAELLDMEIHRVYSGTPRIPDGVADKPWVEENYQEKLTPGTGIEIDSNNVISTTAQPQVQADWAQSDSTAVDYIQNKPAIPTKTSDLANDSGFITGADLPTVDQTYDASSTNAQSGTAVAEAIAAADNLFVAVYGVTTIGEVDTAYAQGKDIICRYNSHGHVYSSQLSSIVSGIYTFTTTDGFSDYEFTLSPDGSTGAWAIGSRAIPSGTQLVPPATQSDAGEVLTVDQNGVPEWAPAQAPISAGNGISVTNNVVSAKVDGTSVTFNANGELEATAAPQVQSDWAESDQADVSFIRNKPGQTSLVAGANITIVDDAQNNTVTISAAAAQAPVQDVTVDNVSVVNAQGVAEIPRQVNADWNSSAGASEILNKPSIPVIGTVTL